MDRVILADPYFSVSAAEKLLTRIPRTNLQLDIITCLGMTDPDTGKASDICKEYEKFLFSNAKLLHGRLSVRNLRRGNKPVFHDRYLLRFHNDQHIDGFLLSNSLNKMGQNYPFVIAPLEHEVALEVCEYLTQMFDAKLQEKKPPKERIICDVLYDSTVKPTAQDKKKLSPSPLKEWLGTEYCENGRNTIPKENLSVAVTEVWNHWGQDKEGVCRVLGELCSNVFRWSIEDVAETLDADAREQWEQLYQQLLSLLAADLLHCSEQERNTALFWLYDNEQCSQCSLQLDLSRYIEDSTIRDAVLQKAVEGIQKYLIDSKYERNLKTAVDLYLTSAEQLYGGEVEKQILGKLVDWRTFERAAEPELKNYAYDKWHYAYIRAKWQLFLLAKYAQLHPGAEKTLKWLKEWRTRLPNIANEESGTNLTGS